MQRRVSLEERLADGTFIAVKDAFLILLVEQGFASKHQIMQRANAAGQRDRFPWLQLIRWVNKHQPGVLILGLTQLMFYGPRAKARQGVMPSRYVSRTYKAAVGYASVAQFVQISSLHREIAETRFHQQEIRAARAAEHAQAFKQLMGPAPAAGLDLLEGLTA